jgi:glycosyltransferase involved in cell wall biosynthesis
MKILYIITKSNWGGAQRYVHNLAVEMKSAGNEVWVALGGDGLLKDKLSAEGIYTFPINSLGRDINTGKDAASFKEIYTIIKNKRPDVIHLNSPKAAGLGALAGRMLRVPKIITTVHGWSFNEDRAIIQQIAITFFSWLTTVLSHLTIVLSEKEFGQTANWPLVRDKIIQIPLGIKPPTFISVEGAKHAMAKLIGLTLTEFNKKTVIGTIAELNKNKGLKYLIEAAATVVIEHPQAIFIVIGEGEMRAELTSLITENKLEKNFYLAGYLDNASEYMKAFNIFVMSSIKEGSPYALLEAGSASLPVVSSTVGGIPEIIEDMKSGILVQAKKSRELGHAISFMIEHPEERKKYGAALKDRVNTKFAFSKMVAEIAKVYSL